MTVEKRQYKPLCRSWRWYRVICSAIVVVCLATATAHAQETPYKFSAGIAVGMSGYLGDASTNLLKHPGFTASGIFAYQYDSRWNFVGRLGIQTLSGDTSGMDNVLPAGATYSFKSQVYDLEGNVEFNFFSYGIGETYKKLKRWTPYLSLGVGLCMACSDGYTAWAPTLPMGFGVRYKVSERWNLSASFVMVKAFGDHVDGKELTDLHHIKSSFVKNNDWYSRFQIGVTYEFGRRCETCHYVD